MPSTRLTTLAVALVALALTTLGCGKSASSSTPSTATQPAASTDPTTPKSSTIDTRPLTRAQLISKGNTICYRLNARRVTTVVRNRRDYERLVPSVVAYELAGATEMSKLTPPASMAQAWQQIIDSTRAIAQATGHPYTEATSPKTAKPIDAALTQAINELTAAAKHAGIAECAKFQ